MCEINIDYNSNDLNDFYCSCSQYSSSGSCKHIAACLIHFQEEIFNIKPSNEKIELITSQLFEILRNNKKQNIKELKEEIKLEINLFCNNNPNKTYFSSENKKIIDYFITLKNM